MITNKRLFYLAFIPFIISLILNFPFPHKHPYGEELVSIFNIPIVSTNGLQYVGITSFILLLISLIMLFKSLRKYQGWLIFLAIIIAVFLPNILVETYQKNFAKGINAISYEQESSECNFNMLSDDIMQAVCEFPFQNYSNHNVSFFIDFYENYPFEEDIKMVSLLRQNAPFKATIKGNDHEVIKIKTNIDVSSITKHVTNGSASEVSIIIKQGENLRKL